MRPDLLEAQANIDWPVSHFDSLQVRLGAWMHDNIHVVIKDQPAESPNDVMVALVKEPLPLILNVEVGAYLHCLRTALDILATALCRRHGAGREDEAYFPIARDDAAFAAGTYKGHKFIQRLPDEVRDRIKSLKPYRGGDPYLWALHHLDLVRKHRQLLTVAISPKSFWIMGPGQINDYVTPVSTGWMRVNDEETVLALVKKGGPKPEVQFTPRVAFHEPGFGRLPIIHALRRFAETARATIEAFDTP